MTSNGYPDLRKTYLGELGNPVFITKDNAFEVMTNAMKVLDEQNIPQKGRWMILPPPKYPRPRSKKRRIQEKWFKHGIFGKPRGKK